MKDDDSELIISFNKLIKCGFHHVDNSTLLLLRLLDMLDLKGISIAGFDGYQYDGKELKNYATTDLELSNVRENPQKLNEEIALMLSDYMTTRKSSCKISFITASRFNNII